MASVKLMNIWGPLDEIAALFSIERMDDETNINLRRRIVNRKTTNSTFQGLLNSGAGLFDLETKPVSSKKVFFSTHAPISMAECNLKYGADVSYQEPVIKDGTDVYTIITSVPADPTLEIDVKDVTNVIDGKYWTLYKNVTGGYFPTWEASYVPDSVVFIYQTIIDNEITLVEESSKKLIWENGIITEE